VPKFSWKLALLFVLGEVALLTSPVVVNIALVLCVVWALFGPRQAIQALAMSVIVMYSNEALVTLSSASGALSRLVLIAAALRVWPLIRLSDLGRIWPIWLFAVLAASTSMMTSPAVAISIMKVITFAVVTTTIIVAYNQLSLRRLEELQTWIMTLGLVVVGLSLLTLARPSIAFHRTGTGLQGILGHPQSLAVLLAPFAAWLVAGLTMVKGKLRILPIVVTVTVCLAMLMTEARTAAAALAFGTTLAMLRSFGKVPAGTTRPSLVRLVGFACAAVVALVIVGLTTDKLSHAAADFLMKRSGARDVGHAFAASRGDGIASQWQHFLNKPLTGNGFGVYPDGHFPAGVAMWGDIPISAPVEKGFVPTAILEETGALGGLTFFLLVFMLGLWTWKSGDPRMMALFGACIGVNVGEAVILAPGGIGLLVWILIGLASAGARSRRPTKQKAMDGQSSLDSDSSLPVAAPTTVAHA
jgi:hypothetical protein